MSSKRKRDSKGSPSSVVPETKNLEINTLSCSLTKYESIVTWKIGNVNCKSICSPTFTSLITNNKKVDWCLVLSRNSVLYNIMLECMSPISCLRMKMLRTKCFIIDKNNEKCNFHKTTTRPIGKYSSMKSVGINHISHGNKDLKKGLLTIVCKINYEEDLSHHSSMSERLKEFDNFEKLLDNDEFSDVKLIVENKEICAHRNILSMRSSVFSAMFKHNMKEGQENVIQINDIKYEVMKEVLRYIYAGKVNNINDLARDLLVAADKYKIDGLKSDCEQALIDSMNVENIGTILLLVDHYNLNSLKFHVFDFLKYKVVDIDSPSFNLVLKALSSTFSADVRSMSKVIY